MFGSLWKEVVLYNRVKELMNIVFE